MEEKKLTGYPSIDKPWLKYYSEEAIEKKLTPNTVYGYLWDCNKKHLDDIALVFLRKRLHTGNCSEKSNSAPKV